MAFISWYPCFITQIATFFRVNISYEGSKAYCVVLSKVPGLSSEAIYGIRMFLKDGRNGAFNNPRRFSTQELADKGIVSTIN